MYGQQNIKIPLVVHSNFGQKLTTVVENLNADPYGFLPVFRKADLFIGMKDISNASCRNERNTSVPTTASFPDVLWLSRTETATTVATC